MKLTANQKAWVDTQVAASEATDTPYGCDFCGEDTTTEISTSDLRSVCSQTCLIAYEIEREG